MQFSLSFYLETMTTSSRASYESLPTLMQLAGFKSSGMKKAQMVAALDTYLGNESRILELWNRLEGVEKALMEQYLRNGMIIETEEIKQILEQYQMEYERRYWSYHFLDNFSSVSPARFFFIGRNIPQAIFEILISQVKSVEVAYTPLDIPVEDYVDQVVSCEESFERDISNIIQLVNTVKLRTTKGSGLPTKASVIQMNDVLMVKEPTFADETVLEIRTIEQTTRIYGLSSILLEAAILVQKEGVLTLGKKAKAFLSASRLEKCGMLLEAYVRSMNIDETGRIIELKTKRDKRGSLESCREVILSLLSKCPVGDWIDIKDMLTDLRINNRGFLRSAAGEILTYDDYERHYYTGMHGWDAIEGRYVQVVLLEYLSGIGIVDVGLDEIEDEYGTRLFVVKGVRLTPTGAQVLGVEGAFDGEEADSTGKVDSGLVVMPSGDIILSEGRMKQVHQLFFDRFAERVVEGGLSTYNITFGHMVEALNQGITISTIIDYIVQYCEAEVPNNILRMLSDWEVRCCEIRIRRVTIVESDDPNLIEELRQVKAIKQHMVGALSNAIEIKEKAAAKVKKEVEKLQYFCVIDE